MMDPRQPDNTDNIDTSEQVIDSGDVTLKPRKTGPKPKELVEASYLGIPVGRDKKVIDPEDVEKLAALGCRDNEIANWFGINEDTLRYNFKDNLVKGRRMTALDSIYDLEQEELAIGITVPTDEHCIYVSFDNIGDVEQQRRLAHYLYPRLKQIPHKPIEVRLTEGSDLIVVFGNITLYADRLNFEQHLKIWLSKLD